MQEMKSALGIVALGALSAVLTLVPLAVGLAWVQAARPPAAVVTHEQSHRDAETDSELTPGLDPELNHPEYRTTDTGQWQVCVGKELRRGTRYYVCTHWVNTHAPLGAVPVPSK